MDGNTNDTDWYLQAWLRHLGKRQAALVNELGWLKGRASKVWNSQIAYRRELVNEISGWLGIRPYELLMPPEEALSLRRLRETAAQIVADQELRFVRNEEVKPGESNEDRRHYVRRGDSGARVRRSG